MNVDVEVLSWTLTMSAPSVAVEDRAARLSERRPDPIGRRKIYDAHVRDHSEASIYRREDLRSGDRFPVRRSSSSVKRRR